MAKPTRVSETPATAFLKAHGVPYTEHSYEYVEHGGAEHSAKVLGLDPFTVVKTLVMQDEKGKPLIVLIHGNRSVSTKNLARQIGVKSVEPCKPEDREPTQRLPGGRHLTLRHAQADARLHRAQHPGPCRRSASTVAGADTSSASTRRSACVSSAPNRSTAR